MKEIFDKMFPEKVITAKVIGNVEYLYKKCLKLKMLKEELEYTRILNE